MPVKPTKRTFILHLRNGGLRKITIPSNWKMTYGSVVPYSRGHASENSSVALRLYENNKENLRAVMCDVVMIRDATIQIWEKHESPTPKNSSNPNKSTGTSMLALKPAEWVNPDIDPATQQAAEYYQALQGVEEVEF